MSEELPRGWVSAPLGEIAELSLGKMLDKKQQTGKHPTPYMRNINVRWHSFDLGDLAQMDISPSELDRVTVRSGDLVVCEGGEPGRCAVWRGDPVAIQKALHRVRPIGSISSSFLAFAIEWQTGRHGFDRYVTGTTIKHIPQERLAQLPVPLPPLAEQQRIVAELDRRLSHLERALASLRSVESMLALARRGIYGLAVSAISETAGAGASDLVQLSAEVGHQVEPVDDIGWPVIRLGDSSAAHRSWQVVRL